MRAWQRQDGLAREAIPIFCLFAFWAAWVCVASLVTRTVNGYFLIIHGAAEALAGLCILCIDLPAFRRIGRWPRISLGLGHSIWALGDLFWAFNYFIANQGGEAAMGLTVSICCLISFHFLVHSVGLNNRAASHRVLRPASQPDRLVDSNRHHAGYACAPSGIERHLGNTSFYAVCEIATLVSAYILLGLSTMVLLASRDLGWSVHAAGIMGALLGDSAIRIGKILGGSTDVDVFLILCSGGFYASVLPVMRQQEKSQISAIDFRSLFTSCKIASLAIIVSCVAVLLSGQARDLLTTRLVSLCCGFGAFVAIFLSTFFVAKIKTLATLMGSILQSLPVRPRRTYRRCLSNYVSTTNLFSPAR